MRVLGIEGPKIAIRLGGEANWGSNRVQILTGKNGSGKSELLVTLIDVLGVSRKYRAIVAPFVDAVGIKPCSRFIAQTFSPFTRFPAENEKSSLSDGHLGNPRHRGPYFCLGLNRSTRTIGTSVSKRVLENSLYRLSDAPNAVTIISKIMHSMRFENELDLQYEITPALSRLIGHKDNQSYLENLLQGSISLGIPKLIQKKFLREVKWSGLGVFLEGLRTALHAMETLDRSTSNIIRYRVLDNTRSLPDHHMLKHIAFLSQLDLLTLKVCAIRSSPYGYPIDISNTSSGQQQMLCSLISLAITLRDDSLVLIDEPELSLHPRWQSTYLRHLNELLQSFDKCDVLIATHSPIIVERGIEMGAGIIKMDDHTALPRHVFLQQSVEEILINVFETAVPRSAHVANEIFEAINSGEQSSDESWSASLLKLNNLKRIYEQDEVQDEKLLKLIVEAIAYVREMVDFPSADKESADDA